MATMKPLSAPDSHHLLAAQGWFELGDPVEANEELEKITPQMRVHPDVLKLRWEIYAVAKQWDFALHLAKALIRLAPDDPLGWIHRSYTLHELNCTSEAFDQLAAVAERFPTEWIIPYNLACYCAQLERLEECQKWFKEAMAIDEHTVKRTAIDDPDLKPLWDSMSGTMWKRSD
jgi:tetratricopeptide (TPR) repeat protein